MSLRQQVLDFIARAQRRPADASSPDELAQLSKAVERSWDGAFAAQHAPIAPFTWEVGVVMLSTQASSERVPLKVPYNCEIVGFLPVLESLATGGATVPTIASLDVSIDINESQIITNANGTMLPGAGSAKDGAFVSLAAMSILAPRLFGLKLDAAVRPDIGFTFRWKAGVNVYKDTIVRVSCLARKIGK